MTFSKIPSSKFAATQITIPIIPTVQNVHTNKASVKYKPLQIPYLIHY